MGPNFRDWPPPGPSFNQRFDEATKAIDDAKEFTLFNPAYKLQLLKALGVVPPDLYTLRDPATYNSRFPDNKTFPEEMRQHNTIGELLERERRMEQVLENPKRRVQEIPNMGYYLDPTVRGH